MEVEGTPWSVSVTLAVNNRGRYDVWIMRVSGAQSEPLALEVNTGRRTYSVGFFRISSKDNHITMAGCSYGFLNRLVLERNFDEVHRLKLNGNVFVLGYCDGISIIFGRIVIGVAPSLDSITRIRRCYQCYY